MENILIGDEIEAEIVGNGTQGNDRIAKTQLGLMVIIQILGCTELETGKWVNVRITKMAKKYALGELVEN